MSNVMPGQNEFFREVTLRVSSSLDITEALCNVFSYLERYLPIDTIGMYRISMERLSLFAVAEVTRDGDAIRAPQVSRNNYPLDSDFMAQITDVLDSGRLVTIHNDAATLPRSILRCFPHLSHRSVMGLDLRIKGENTGGLSLSVEGRGRYLPRHAALLELVREPLALALSNAWRFHELGILRDRLADDNRELALDVQRSVGEQIIGANFGLAQVMEMVRRVASLSSQVLLLGETGTGKEVIANAIHLFSPRNKAPMVRVQCGAIPETLLDSELFGHEKGAFTGAAERRRGRFERAVGGTIFLDEIAELTPEAQVKLLRVLQEKQFERVGGTETLDADVRVIAATHRDLAQMVRAGSFREDLWYRLNVFPIYIPPLRMRRQDIPPLAHYFIERKAREMNLGHIPKITSEALERLQNYDWPGNVRELQNLIERTLILSRGGALQFPPLNISQPAPSIIPKTGAADEVVSAVNFGANHALEHVIAEHIRSVLSLTRGRVAGAGGAAEILNINPNTLRSKMRKLGITIARRPVATHNS